jgi:hypothetical protein
LMSSKLTARMIAGPDPTRTRRHQSHTPTHENPL